MKLKRIFPVALVLLAIAAPAGSLEAQGQRQQSSQYPSPFLIASSRAAPIVYADWSSKEPAFPPGTISKSVADNRPAWVQKLSDDVQAMVTKEMAWGKLPSDIDYDPYQNLAGNPIDFLMPNSKSRKQSMAVLEDSTRQTPGEFRLLFQSNQTGRSAQTQSFDLHVSDSFARISRMCTFRRDELQTACSLNDSPTPVNRINPDNAVVFDQGLDLQDSARANIHADSECLQLNVIPAATPLVVIPEPVGAPTMILSGFAIGILMCGRRKIAT